MPFIGGGPPLLDVAFTHIVGGSLDEHVDTSRSSRLQS